MDIYFITLVDKDSIDKTINLQKSLYPEKLHIIDTYDCELKNLSKIYKTYEYIKTQNNIKTNDIVCIIDGHDMLFNRKSGQFTNSCKGDDIKKKFIEKNVDIIISSESKFSHHCNSVKEFFEQNFKKPFCYLNSGFIIAYKEAYINMFSDIIDNIDKYKSHLKSDQRILSLYIMDKTISNNLPVKLIIDDDLIFSTTLNTNTNLKLDEINSFFIHITFLKDSNQLLKYNKLIDLLNIK
jgi:hypothetical protein